MEAKVMAASGADELGANKLGELYIRGPTIARGYLARPELTPKVFLSDGWLKTGDFGFYDDQHRVYVRDRIQVSTIRVHHPRASMTD